MKLFQIEEPEGGPTASDEPGAAIGIDLSGKTAEAAFSVGGNAVLLADRDGFEQLLLVPPVADEFQEWRELFERLRLRAERALARPVTHAVIAFRELPDGALSAEITAAAEEAGLRPLRLIAAAGLDPAKPPALAAAMLAEDLAPRPQAIGC